jgi:hypothetical protein
MINNKEKIEIIQKRIDDISDLIPGIYRYMKAIEAGMEDPGIDISRSLSLIEEINLKVQALEEEKQALTIQG